MHRVLLPLVVLLTGTACSSSDPREPTPTAVCGNNRVEADEECDDGNDDDTDACTTACMAARCGDGFLQPGEACDDGDDDQHDECTSDCRAPTCGDGLVQLGEHCDDGNDDDTDSCTNNCLAPSCGDGFVQAGEECDDGNDDNTDSCTNNCLAPACGDGFVQAGEECDDANDDNTDSCTNDCLAPACGDGFVQAGEECDDGNDDNTDSCTTACAAARCGDGFVQAGEACDDANDDNTDACTTACAAARCGDGFVQAGEACDDANEDNTDACTTACAAARCGDGFVQVGEACDDANDDNTDACTTTCAAARCGDGFLQPGEWCDDGDGNGASCTTTCNYVYTFTTAGTLGRQGPTQAALDAEYAGTALASAVTATPTGIQMWTVPASGTYRIAALGAAGSAAANRGASIAGDFGLVAGDKLFILVGQMGTVPRPGTHEYNLAGGGGTFVAIGPSLGSTTPLIVAGGGGGGHSSLPHLAGPGWTCGSTSHAGNGGYASVNGGVDGTWGGASGGMDQAAGFYSGPGESSASAFQDGGLGALAGRGPSGGFGGGGAVHTSTSAFLDAATSGGGGGFSGGGSATTANTYGHPAGGGGSFNGGTNQTMVACANSLAPGRVEITALTPAPVDATAPTPGGSVTVEAVTGTSVTLAWNESSDDRTARDDLQYTVVYSTTNNLGSIDDAFANGTLALLWSRAVPPTHTVPRLSENTTYHFAVLVRDASGNVAIYPSTASATTKRVFLFTTAGASGRQGPTQTAIDAAYAGTSLASSVTATTTGIQRWTVPTTGTYRIEAHGAQGATLSSRHARGASMRGTFDLTAGDTLWILVGQQGSGTPGPYAGIGGGGGTFVARGGILADSSPLIVAGGGGGWGLLESNEIDFAQPDSNAASISTSGNRGAGGIAGGTDGSKGGVFVDSFTSADAAAGFFSGQGGVTSQAFQDGGLGALYAGADGGFGGGGAPRALYYAISGGGGGYSGGASSRATNGSSKAAGGGGSFNVGIDQRNDWGANSGHGKVVIVQQ